MLMSNLFLADDGEIFQVKKSSQSRRLIKQLKAEKRAAKKNGNGFGKIPHPPPPPSLSEKSSDFKEKTQEEDSLTSTPTIRFKDNIKNKRQEITSWTISGKEAEALHMEDEDSDGDPKNIDEMTDPLQRMLQSG